MAGIQPPAAVGTSARRRGTLRRLGGPLLALFRVCLAALGAAAVALAAPAGCVATSLPPHAVARSTPVTFITLTDVAFSPERFYGRAVSVDGVVDTMIGPHAFVLRADRPLEVGALLVVSRQPVIPVSPSGGIYVVQPRDLVRIAGTVRSFDLTAFERDLRIDLAGDLDAFLAPWQDKPAIVVDSIRAIESLEFAPTAPVMPLDALLEDPSAFIGHAVTVEGRFDRQVAPHAFLLEDRSALFDEELLVVTPLAFESIPGWPEPAAAAFGSAALPVTVRGVVQLLDVTGAERAFALDLDDTLLAAYAGRPVLLSNRMGVTPGVTQILPPRP